MQRDDAVEHSTIPHTFRFPGENMPSLESATSTVVVCCHVSGSMSSAEVACWRELSATVGASVTWTVGSCDASRWLECHGGGKDVALRIESVHPMTLDRGEVRRALAVVATGEVRSVFAGGDSPLDHRDLLVDHGIEVACVRRLHPVGRRSRRPAPKGWSCRSVVWGLWETEITPPRRSWLGAFGGNRLRPGGLTIIETGGTLENPAEVLRRLKRTLARLTAVSRSGNVRTAHLADLPELIRGSHATEDGGSILKAA